MKVMKFGLLALVLIGIGLGAYFVSDKKADNGKAGSQSQQMAILTPEGESPKDTTAEARRAFQPIFDLVVADYASLPAGLELERAKSEISEKSIISSFENEILSVALNIINSSQFSEETQKIEAYNVHSPSMIKISQNGEEKFLGAFQPIFEQVLEGYKDIWKSPNFTNDKRVVPDWEIISNFEKEILPVAFKIINSEEYLAWAQKMEAESNSNIIEGKAEKGDTISSILELASEEPIQHFVDAAKKIFSQKTLKEGQPYLVELEPETGRVASFEYEIDNTHNLVIEGVEDPKARLEKVKYTTKLVRLQGLLEDNLFKAVADIGESPELAMRLVKLFGSEINFVKNLKKGDSFSILMEKRYRDDEFKGYGRIIAAVFNNQDKTYEAFLFPDGLGGENYYNDKGESINKTLLQSPLPITRVTSRFAESRFHPILHSFRPHYGVDYGAPIGTPVKAVGSGVVTELGWAGGYGNQIVIKHNAGLESLYSHLAAYAKGMRVGEKVEQGQIIGFVGSTGLSTGPHLDFRLRQNGNFVNPENVINPRSHSVAQVNMKAFKKTQKLARAALSGEKIFENYSMDSIVPLKVVSVQEEFIQGYGRRGLFKARPYRGMRRFLRRDGHFRKLKPFIYQPRPL